MIEIRPLGPAFGAEVIGLAPRVPLDDETRTRLRAAFDERGLLVFRDLDIDYPTQVYLTTMLIGRETEVEDPASGQPTTDDTWYISNQRENSVAPFGRLQFHSDGMWADETFEVLSLYGTDVEQPAVPTTFVSAAAAWRTLPDELRAEVGDLRALHTTGEVRRGDLTDVFLTSVEKVTSTVKPIALEHPRTGTTVLYACEQMTQEIPDLDPHASEQLLVALFDHMYEPDATLDHHWRERDLVVWDNIAVQHARANVGTDGPARTFRKVGHPMPRMAAEEIPVSADAR